MLLKQASIAAAPATVIGASIWPLTVASGRPDHMGQPSSASRETCLRIELQPADGVLRDGLASAVRAFVRFVIIPLPDHGIDAMSEATRHDHVTLHICVTCRAGQVVAEGELTPGARLFQTITERGALPGVAVVPVECLSACSQGCSISLSGPGRWSYVYGRLSDADADAIRQGAAAYVDAPDGLVPWRSRPEIFRKQSIARIPPLPACQEAAE